MQDFLFDKTKVQEAAPEPYTLFNKEQAVKDMAPRNETLRDIEYFRSMYPARVKSLQLIVEEVFDEMDYEASPIYDEYPDRILVERMFQKVRGQIGDGATATAMDEQPQAEAQAIEKEKVVIQERTPHMPYGPMYIVQSIAPNSGSYKTWEVEDQEMRTEQLDGARSGNPWGPPPPPPPPRPWGPPPPHPWGPPPPPPRPWGPPPPPRPWGPPPPPRPWGPPPPPRPWGPPPPRPGDRADLDDLLRLLLFGEMQRRRCHRRNCR